MKSIQDSSMDKVSFTKEQKMALAKKDKISQGYSTASPEEKAKKHAAALKIMEAQGFSYNPSTGAYYKKKKN